MKAKINIDGNLQIERKAVECYEAQCCIYYKGLCGEHCPAFIEIFDKDNKTYLVELHCVPNIISHQITEDMRNLR